MDKPDYFARGKDYVERKLSIWCHRRIVPIRCEAPTISFSFDDFPKSAWECGGRILASHGARGTYYTSFGLLGKMAPVGQCFDDQDVHALAATGHELGCHTFSHSHAWRTEPEVFRRDLELNDAAFKARFPGHSMQTMSYPISGPRPGNKKAAGERYICCRGGGQTFNVGQVDANFISAYFLEKARGDLSAVHHLIDQTCRANGWLVFATHDVTANPTRFGCTPDFFENIVKYAVDSRARILPVGEAWRIITSAHSKTSRAS